MAGLWLGAVSDGRAAEIDPAQLTRHGVVFGATGSGKTGLCVCLLEELALAGVPVLAIDPKGDLANLALRFRGPTADELAPWVDPGVAERAGLAPAAWAADEAARQASGRAASGVAQDRVDRLVDGVEVVVHTPGNGAGVPVDVLGGLATPPAGTERDPEALADLARGAVSALLDLVGVRADPLRDPRHIVMTRLLEDAWAAGEAFDLERLVLRLVDPPFDRVGVFPLEQFLGRDDRMAVALQLNGLLAGSAFAAWRQGVSLDVDALLAPVAGRTPVRVFSLAHLQEPQRQFFGAMLLHRVVAWSRRQPGTSALRAVVYVDEAYGWCPPHPAQPATKAPLMTLVKQARAVGLGVLITSQNPVDVDHAVISNAGTWWLGRLGTIQDRRRVLEGLADDEAGAIGAALDGLGKWEFAIRVAGRAPWTLRTRHAVTWLRGPLTLREIERLPQQGPPATVARATTPPPDDRWLPEPPPAPRGYPVRWLDPRIAHSPRLEQAVGQATEPARADGAIAWEPALYCRVHLRFESREFREERVEDRLFFPMTRDGGFAGFPGLEEGDLRDAPPGPGVYAPLPEHADEPAELAALEKRVREGLLSGETAEVYELPAVKLRSRGGETLDAFRARALEALDAAADAEIAKLKAKVDAAVDRLEAKHAQLTRDVERLQADARSRVGTELVNAGEIVFGLFFGGRKKSLSTAMSKREQTVKAQGRVGETEAKLTEITREIYELDTDTERQISEIRERHRARVSEIVTREVRLDRQDIRLDDFGVLWIPVSRPL